MTRFSVFVSALLHARTSSYFSALVVATAVLGGGCSDPYPNLECSPARGIECPNGETCIENVCVSVCTDDNDCDVTEECVDSTCVTREFLSCSASEPCGDGLFCDNGLCTAKWNLAHICDEDDQCASGFCADGVCCTDACNNSCDSCLFADTGVDDGICAAVSAGDDPKDGCTGVLACNGSGACFNQAVGATCSEAYECISGFCDGTNCLAAVCGDGNQGGTEECDDGINDGAYLGCNSDCTLAGFCGDGGVDNGFEDCDDGVNEGAYDGCNDDCTLASYCGDGTEDTGFEDCDDGINDGTYLGCNSDCTLAGYCGDGTPDAGFEQCDDGTNAGGYGGCESTCAFAPRCGDSNVDAGNEDCDDGDDVDTNNGCSSTCARNDSCGNGNVESLYETCEPPNTPSCDANCQSQNPCGNGQLDGIEECDDDNLVGADGCSDTCVIEPAWQCSGEPSVCVRIIYVASNATGANDGSSWPNSFVDLQDGLSLARTIAPLRRVEIWVRQGTYYPAAPGGARGATFELESNVGLYGGFQGPATSLGDRDPDVNVTRLDGDLNADDLSAGLKTDNVYHVLTAINVDATAVVDGFRIRRGYADGSATNALGGGMYAQNASPTVLNSRFVNNYAGGDGGGVYSLDGDLELTNVQFNDNEAVGSGGGWYAEGGAPEMVGGEFNTNVAGALGGGMGVQSGSFDFSMLSIDGNTAQTGGGIGAVDSLLLGDRTAFTGNFAPSGGGLSLEGQGGGPQSLLVNGEFLQNQGLIGAAVALTGVNLRFVNCVVGDHTMPAGPVAVFMFYAVDSDVFLNSSTIAFNSLGGGSDYPGIIAGGSSTVTLDSTVVFWNRAALVSRDLGTAGAGTIVASYCTTSSETFAELSGDTTTCSTSDPLLVSQTDLRLQSNSTAIDAGNPAGAFADLRDLDGDGNVAEPTPFDLDGNPRLHNTVMDRGAYEYQ